MRFRLERTACCCQRLPMSSALERAGHVVRTGPV